MVKKYCNFDKDSMPQLWQEVKSHEDFWQDIQPHVLKMVKSLLEGSMEADRDEYIEVKRNKKESSRKDSRNGYYSRDWQTGIGMIEGLMVPRCRNKGSKDILTRYNGNENKINKSIQDIYIAGVSTRRVGEVLKPIYGVNYSAAMVSKVMKEMDILVKEYHNRELRDEYKYIIFDGIVLKGKNAIGKKKRVALVAYGIKVTGQRELIDFMVGDSESEGNWFKFINNLYNRGLKGLNCELIVTDGGKGLHAALDMVYPRVRRQRCWVHKIRNVAKYVKKRYMEGCLRQAKGIYRAQSKRQAIKRYRKWAERWQDKAPKAVECIEKDIDELLNFFDMPKEHRVKVRTTNVIERLFREVRRRIRPMNCFANDSSCDRILFGILRYLNDKWAYKKYLIPIPGESVLEEAA